MNPVKSMLNDIRNALGLHRSMAKSGELPTETSEASFDAAMGAIKTFRSQSLALEAMLAVDSINGDLDAHYHDLGYFDDRDKQNQMPTPGLTLVYGGTWCAVEFESFCLWSSENDEREWPENDDDQEPLESFLRKQMAIRTNTMRMMPV